MRIQTDVTKTALRLLRIPILGFGFAFVLSYAIGNDPGAGLFFGLLGAVLLYLPLLGLLYFESKNWVEIRSDGLYIKTSDYDRLVPWDAIKQIHTSRDSLQVLIKDSDSKILLYFLSEADKKQIYKAHFDRVGLQPNQSAYADKYPGYLNWDQKS